MTASRPPAAGIGRTSQLTPEVRESIVRAVKVGNYLKVAAQTNGIAESTLRSWLTRGRKAGAAIDAHDPDALYCPACDLDRTAAVREEYEANLAEERRYEEAMTTWREADHPPKEAVAAEPTRAYAVLDRCPSCGTSDRPAAWELPALERPYLSFLEAVTQAESAAEVAAVTHWRAAFADDWRAARDFLVRKSPDRWAATTRVQISQEETERRVEQATMAALTALGIDTDLGGPDPLLDGMAAELAQEAMPTVLPDEDEDEDDA